MPHTVSVSSNRKGEKALYRRYKKSAVPPFYSGFALTGTPSYSEGFYPERVSKEASGDLPDLCTPQREETISAAIKEAEDNTYTHHSDGTLFDSAVFSEAAARAVYNDTEEDNGPCGDSGEGAFCGCEDKKEEPESECSKGENEGDKERELKMKFSLEEIVFMGILLVFALKNGEGDTEEIMLIIGLLLLLS